MRKCKLVSVYSLASSPSLLVSWKKRKGDLGLYLHIMLKMFVETRGAEDFETLGDTHAREQFASHFEELEPIHAQLNSSHLEMTLVSACIADMKRVLRGSERPFRSHYLLRLLPQALLWR